MHAIDDDGEDVTDRKGYRKKDDFGCTQGDERGWVDRESGSKGRRNRGGIGCHLYVTVDRQVFGVLKLDQSYRLCEYAACKRSQRNVCWMRRTRHARESLVMVVGKGGRRCA